MTKPKANALSSGVAASRVKIRSFDGGGDVCITSLTKIH